MEGILFGINQTSEGTINPRLDENDESPPPPLPLRQPRVVRPPVHSNSHFYAFSYFSNHLLYIVLTQLDNSKWLKYFINLTDCR